MLLVRKENNLTLYYGELFPIPKRHDVEQWVGDYGSHVLITLRIDIEKISDVLLSLFEFFQQSESNAEKKDRNLDIHHILELNKLLMKPLIENIALHKPKNNYCVITFEKETGSYPHLITEYPLRWPRYKIEIDFDSQLNHPKELVRFSLPYFEDGYSILHLFFRRKKYYGELKSSLVIYLPTFEFRFKEVLTENDVVKVIGQFGSSVGKATITGIGRVSERDNYDIHLPQKEIDAKTLEIKFNLNKKVDSVRLVAFHPKDNRILATYWTNIISLPEEIELSLEGIEKLIKQGEGQKLEFKKEFNANANKTILCIC